jgi:hypothetical protein
MSNRYTDKYIYAVDKNNGLYCLAMRYFASLANAYYSVTCVKDRHYEVFSIVDDCYEITGEKIDIPELEDWIGMLCGENNKTVEDLMDLCELKAENVNRILIVYVEGSHRGPCEYCAQLIIQNKVYQFTGYASELFDKYKPEPDDTWKIIADIVAQNILQEIENYR